MVRKALKLLTFEKDSFWEDALKLATIKSEVPEISFMVRTGASPWTQAMKETSC
jgi:hypothetical protein